MSMFMRLHRYITVGARTHSEDSHASATRSQQYASSFCVCISWCHQSTRDNMVTASTNGVPTGWLRTVSSLQYLVSLRGK